MVDSIRKMILGYVMACNVIGTYGSIVDGSIQALDERRPLPNDDELTLGGMLCSEKDTLS